MPSFSRIRSVRPVFSCRLRRHHPAVGFDHGVDARHDPKRLVAEDERDARQARLIRMISRHLEVGNRGRLSVEDQIFGRWPQPDFPRQAFTECRKHERPTRRTPRRTLASGGDEAGRVSSLTFTCGSPASFALRCICSWNGSPEDRWKRALFQSKTWRMEEVMHSSCTCGARGGGKSLACRMRACPRVRRRRGHPTSAQASS
jgi:hypothetical protein